MIDWRPATSRRRRGSYNRTVRRDSGSATVEAVLILPLMVILTMVIVQSTLVWHGRHVAQAAAHTGALAAAAYLSTAAAGRSEASAYVDQVAPKLLTKPDVSAARDTDTATVIVKAHVLSVVPFADFDITEQATAPVETFVGAER